MDFLAIIAVVVCVVSFALLGARLLVMRVRNGTPTGMLGIALLFALPLTAITFVGLTLRAVRRHKKN